MTIEKKLMIWVSILGVLGVVLGAFGAHGLKNVLSENSLVSYNTGIRYHFYHVLALFGMIVLYKKEHSKWYLRAAWCFIVGIVLFSGSIYLLATKDIIGISNAAWLGPITPIGGVFFIVGWSLLGVAAIKSSDR